MGAYAAKGEYSYGFSMSGIKMKSTVGGSFGAAHIGFSSNFFHDNNNGTLNFELQENLGLGVGEKLGFKIQIPLPYNK